MSVLSLEQVRHSYRGQEALREISLDIDRGVTALIGVNGAGKSTFLTIAAGALRPSAGSVRVGGDLLYRASSRRRALGKVALMPQTATFPSAMTAREVVEYLTWMRGARMSAARAAAEDALRRVLLTDRADSAVKSLSGGMLRRLCLAQAIAAGAEIVLLDEPSTGLDPEQRRVMVTLLAELEGAVVLSSHVMEDVNDLAERVLVINDGDVVFDGNLPALAARAPGAAADRSVEAGFLAVLTSRRVCEA